MCTKTADKTVFDGGFKGKKQTNCTKTTFETKMQKKLKKVVDKLE